MLTTEALVTEVPEAASAAPGMGMGGHGHGGDF
jgi:hypothetical protein